MQNVTTEKDVIDSIFANIFSRVLAIKVRVRLTMFQFVLFLCRVVVSVATSIMFLYQSRLVGYFLSHKLYLPKCTMLVLRI